MERQHQGERRWVWYLLVPLFVGIVIQQSTPVGPWLWDRLTSPGGPTEPAPTPAATAPPNQEDTCRLTAVVLDSETEWPVESGTWAITTAEGERPTQLRGEWGPDDGGSIEVEVSCQWEGGLSVNPAGYKPDSRHGLGMPNNNMHVRFEVERKEPSREGASRLPLPSLLSSLPQLLDAR